MKSAVVLLSIVSTLGLHIAPHKSLRVAKGLLRTPSNVRRSLSISMNAAAEPTTETVAGNSGIDYYSLDSADQTVGFGDFNLMASQSETGRKYVDIETMNGDDAPKEGEVVWIRGRVSSVRAKGNACFMVVRSGVFNTIQACHFKDKENPDESKKMIKYVGSLTLESIVDVMGVVVKADVQSCSVTNYELQIKRIYAVSKQQLYICRYFGIIYIMFK